MGWSFRKSFKLGPVRVNLSRRGVGASVGVKGARIGTGPSGAYVSGGVGPVRYFERLGAKRRARARGVAGGQPTTEPQTSGLALGCAIAFALGAVALLLAALLAGG